MKPIHFFLTALLLPFAALSQSCLPEGITFTTQADINNFQVDYPGCTEIEGDLKIEGDDINNLLGLSVLTSIGGDLIIGPDNYWEPALTSLSGLNNLTEVAGNMIIESNPVLQSLTGLEGLTNIGGRLEIESNDALTSLNGMDNLSSIGGALFISGNDGLLSLAGLSNLITINGDLSILWNDNMTSLAGLDNINAGSVENLSVYYNPSLSSCEVQSVCNYLASPNGIVLIGNNASGCNNPPEVASGCGIVLPCLPFGSFIFNTQAEVDNFQYDYPDCYNPGGLVAIHGIDIDNLNGLNIIQSIAGDLVIQYNPILTNLLGLINLKSINNTLEVAGNDILTSLSGLDSIDAGTITDLYIFENTALSTCDLQSVCNYLASPNGTINIYDNAVGCNSQIEVETACAVDLADNSFPENHLTIYPNPASDVLFIESSEKLESVSIFDSRGDKVVRWYGDKGRIGDRESGRQGDKERGRINVGELAPGLYLVRVETGSGVVGRKVVVRR
jgi:hypothetical protein